MADCPSSPALLPSTWPGQGDTGVILEQSREELRGSSSPPVLEQSGEGLRDICEDLNPFDTKEWPDVNTDTGAHLLSFLLSHDYSNRSSLREAEDVHSK